MATPDGSVVIEVNMNTSKADKDLGKLKKEIKKTETDISDMTTKRDKAREKSSLLGGAIEAEMRKLKDFKDQLADFRNRSKDKSTPVLIRQNYQDAIPEAKQQLEDQKARVKAMQSEWNSLEASVERYDAKIAEATEKLEQQKTEAGALQQQINEAVKEYEENIRKSAVSNQDIVELNRELVSLVQQLNELEEKGLTLGYQKYDATISRLAEVESRLRSYQKEITKTQSQEQREKELAQKQMDRAMRDAEALTQKMEAAAAKERAAAEEANRLRAIADNAEVSNERIVNLNKELEALKDRQADLTKAGVGAGYQEFDRNAARITEIRRAIREYQKEMSKPVTPAGDLYNTEGAKEAEVSNQHIVDLNRELLELKKKQAALEKSGAGLGYQEYEQNAARISEIKKELKEYQDSLGKTGAAAEKMNGILEKMISSMASSENAALKSIGTVAGSVVSKVAPALAAAAGVGSVVKSFAGKASASLKSILSGFGKASAAVLEFGVTAAKAFSRAAMGALAFLKKVNVFPKMFSSIGKSFKRLGSIVKSALIFSVIYQGLALVRTQMAAYLRVNTEFSTALRRLQGALLTAFQPIYEVVVPALTSLINVLTRAIATVTQFFAALFGKTAKQAQTNAKDLYEQAKATTAAGNAAEEASKQMASFDEINQLTESKSGGGGGGGAAAETGPLFDYDYEDTPFNSWGEAFSAFLDKLLAGIPELEKSLMGFVDRLNDLAKKLYEMFTFPGVLEKVKQLGEDLANMMNRITDAIEWETIGRALGAGLNLALNFLTSFIYKYNWMNLGRHLAEFINGLVDEIDWYEFGRLLWSGFKIGLETLAGFLMNLNMSALAQAASNIVKGFFDEMKNTIERIPWSQIGLQIAAFINSIDWVGTLSSIATSIAIGINAAITTLGTLIGNLEWAQIGEAVATAFNLLISRINWAGIGETLSAAFEGALTFLYTALSNFDWDAFGTSIGQSLVSINWLRILTQLFDVIREIISGLLESLLSAIQTFWENADPFEKMLLGIAVAVGVVGVAISALISIGTAASNMFKALQTAIQGAQLLFGLLTSPIGLVVVAITAAVAIIAVLITHFDGLREAALNAWDGIKGAFGEAASWLNENLIQPIVDGYNEHIKPVLDTFIEKLTEVVEDHVVPMVEKAIEFFEKVFEALQLAWDTILGPLVTWIIEIAVPQIGNALEFAGEVFNTLLTTVSDVVGGILEALGGVIDFLVGVFTGDWDRAWNGLVDIFKGVWNAIVGALEGAVNLIIGGINFLIGALNKLRIDIPDNPIMGSLSLGFNIPKLSEISIPRLARGAVIPPNREFMAVLGDQRSGTNIETPESLLRDIYRQENSALISMLREILAAIREGKTMTVDGSTFAKLVYSKYNSERKRTGVNLVEERT